MQLLLQISKQLFSDRTECHLGNQAFLLQHRHLWRYCFVCGSKSRHASTASDNHGRGIWPHMFTSVTYASQLAANRFSDGFSYCYWINGEVAAFEQQEPILYSYTGVLSKWKTRIVSLGYYLLAINVTCIPHKCVPHKCLPLLLDAASNSCTYTICW